MIHFFQNDEKNVRRDTFKSHVLKDGQTGAGERRNKVGVGCRKRIS